MRQGQASEIDASKDPEDPGPEAPIGKRQRHAAEGYRVGAAPPRPRGQAASQPGVRVIGTGLSYRVLRQALASDLL